MTGPAPSPTSQTVLREQAVDWHVRLGSDLAGESEWLAFEAWLANSAQHAEAYAQVEALWSALDDAAPGANVTRLRPKARVPHLGAWIGSAAAGLLAAAALGITALSWPHTDTYATPRGERRIIALSDGSRVTLNGGSKLSVRLTRGQRRVEMADAEALFDVAKDPARPFIIQAGDRQIRVVGTQFNVLHHAGEVQVTVRQGTVEVRPSGDSATPLIARLQVGQALTHREGQSGDQVRRVDPEAALAWTEGRLIFRGERLEDVAAVLNRYVETPIVVGPEARDLSVTAVLVLDQEDAMVARLAAFLSLQTRRAPDGIHLSRGGTPR